MTAPLDLSDPHGATATLLVGPDGTVERATISYEATLDGEAVSVRRTLRYVAVGSATVERPGWVDAATGAENETAPG